MDITFVSTTIRLRLETDIPERFALFGIKAAFEEEFRRLAGCPSGNSKECFSVECAYHATFARRISADPSAVKKYQKPSLPFVFSFPILPPVPNNGATCAIKLVLVGSAINHFPLYITAVRSVIGTRFRNLFSIVDMLTEDYSGNGQSVMCGGGFLPERMQILTFRDLETAVCPWGGEVGIRIRTPLVIMANGRPLKNLDFSSFVRPLLRRVSSLAFYYAGYEMSADFAWLAEESTRVKTVASGITWHQWGDGSRGGGRGLGGSCIFRGNLTEFYPFLLFGQYVHVGKGASFGYGGYELDPAPAQS